MKVPRPGLPLMKFVSFGHVYNLPEMYFHWSARKKAANEGKNPLYILAQLRPRVCHILSGQTD